MRSADYQAGRLDAVAGMLALIHAEAQQADGSWNGDDVLRLLRQWFTVHGIDICRPDPAAGQLGAGPAGPVSRPGDAVGKLITAARHVLGSWAMGDLAGAVNELRRALESLDKSGVTGAGPPARDAGPRRALSRAGAGRRAVLAGPGTVAGNGRDE